MADSNNQSMDPLEGMGQRAKDIAEEKYKEEKAKKQEQNKSQEEPGN